MNRVIIDNFIQKLLENDHLGAKTWPCFNQNRVITRSVIKGLKCNNIIGNKMAAAVY